MVSILQLVILIIPGVAFRMLILLAWCQCQGWGTERRWGVGGGGAARRPVPSVSGFPAALLGSPVGSWQAATALQAVSRGSRRRCPGVVGKGTPSGERNSCGKTIT